MSVAGTAARSPRPARLLDGQELRRLVLRLAHEVAERHPGGDPLVIAGIQSGGVPVARAVGDALAAITGDRPLLGLLDITAYRDDVRRRDAGREAAWRAPEARTPPLIDGAVVIVVDDVIHTGRTLRAALDALADQGRPAAVEPLVLIDRGRRELPVRATYVGKNVPAAPGDWVVVRCDDSGGGAAGAWLVQPGEQPPGTGSGAR